jgi:hypothetical protein
MLSQRTLGPRMCPLSQHGVNSSISCMRRMLSLRATANQTSDVFGDLGGLSVWRRDEAPAMGDYPPDWNRIARAVKEAASWRCENPSCRHPHD